MLYSTNVATIFLDLRSESDFSRRRPERFSTSFQATLAARLRISNRSQSMKTSCKHHAVLKNHAAIQREIRGQSGAWFVRRIMPYRTGDEKIEGVVITFEDVTERRNIAEALTVAKREAELASLAKFALSRRGKP